MHRKQIGIWGLLGLLLAPVVASASFHQWGINEIYSNASGTVQFIEMATTDPGELFMQFNQFTSTSQTLTFDHNFDSSTANKKFLMATPGYAALAGVPVPDFTFDNNNFFSITGDTLTLVGGIGDAPNPPSLTFTNGQLPTDGTKSMSFDFSLSTTNSPTNFAGATGTVPEPAVAAAVEALGLLLISRRRAGRPS